MLIQLTEERTNGIDQVTPVTKLYGTSYIESVRADGAKSILYIQTENGREERLVSESKAAVQAAMEAVSIANIAFNVTAKDNNGPSYVLLLNAINIIEAWDDPNASGDSLIRTNIPSSLGTGLEFSVSEDLAGILAAAVSASGGTNTFLALVDTPANYAGAATFFVKVNGAGNALEFVDVDTDGISEGVTNLYYTDERVDDRVAALIQDGTGIAWTYDDGSNTLTGNVVVASDTAAGISETATLAEVNTGTDALRYVTPDTLEDKTYGTFTGSTITDNVVLKVALQELETAVESAGGNTIYSADDALTGNRVVSGGGNSLTFDGMATFTVENVGSIIFNDTSNVQFEIRRSGTTVFEFTDSSSFNTALTMGNVASGLSAFRVSSAQNIAAWGVEGCYSRWDGTNQTDSSTAASATVASAVIHSFGISIINSANGGAGTEVTYTDAATLYIAGAPADVTDNTIITNPLALWVDAGTTRLDGDLDLNGTNIGFYSAAPAPQPTISGSRAGNAALADLLTELATLGLIVDSSS